MKVLILHEGYAPILAGAERIACETARALAERQIAVCLLTEAAPPMDALLPAGLCRRNGLRNIAPADCLRAMGDGRSVAHVIDITPCAASLALRLKQVFGWPIVVSPATHPSFWETHPPCLQLLREADCVLALSHNEATALRALEAEPAQITILPHLGPIAWPQPTAACSSEPYPYVLFLSRMMRSKGYQDLLEATRLVWADAPQMRFVFAGPVVDDDVPQQITRYAEPRITWRGVVSEEEKHSLLSGAAALCLPTRADVLPLVVLEAWSHGTPVISYDYQQPGCNDPLFGPRLLAVPGPAGIAAAILELHSNQELQAQLKRAGPEHLRAHYDMDVNIQRLITIYRRLADNPLRQPLV